MVKIKRPVLLVGDSGTSKTATILNFMKNLSTDTTVSSQDNHVLSHQFSFFKLAFTLISFLFPESTDH